MNTKKRLLSRLDKSEKALAARGPAEERVHEARRQLKKARALLVLGRSALGRARARRAAKALRAAGGALSTLRDAEIAARAYRTLRPHRAGPGAALAARRRAVETTTGAAVEAARRRLDEARPDVARMGRPGKRELGRAAGTALKKVLARGEAALLSPGDEALHAWRKAAKRLQGMLAEAEKPTPWLARLRAVLEELGEALGDDHDLVVLRAALERGGGCAPVAAAAERRRASLLEKAARIAPALSRASPGRLAREFRRSI